LHITPPVGVLLNGTQKKFNFFYVTIAENFRMMDIKMNAETLGFLKPD